MAWLFFGILLSIFTLILLQSSPIEAQNGGKITVGLSLTATGNGSSWLSPSKDFAFGFHQFQNNNDLFLLAIWYDKIPDTIVWYANDGSPVAHGSSVKITANEGLLLSDPQGNNIWKSANDSSGFAEVSYGFMNDTGNFMLKNNSDVAVWQSFENPTDTLLPTQIMKAGGELNSRQSETNFTKGRFQLRFLQDGNLVLNTRDLATNWAYAHAYYNSGTNDPANPENAGDKVIYDESGDLYIQRKNGSKFDVTPANNNISSKNYYQRVTLNFDGVLTWYYHPRGFTGNNNVGWLTLQSLPDNICTNITSEFDSGACGYNSICSIGEDKRPKCDCPPSYTRLDPNVTYSSCVPNFKLAICENQNQGVVKDEYKMERLPNINWPFNDYSTPQPMNEEECKDSCLNDCLCAAAIYNDDTLTCWKKRLPLSNGVTSSGLLATAFLKVGTGNDLRNPISPPKIKYKKNPAVLALLGSSLCVNFVLLSAIVLGIYIIYNKSHFRSLVQHQKVTWSKYSSVHCFSYKELEHATDGFKNEIGRGAFGVVYRGDIGAGDPPVYVAVKKLDRLSKDADKEFEAEVNVIGQTHHKNLVRFIGFCKEEDQRLLVYEYMSNGTVADYLFGDSRPSWTTRIQIAQGVARGLLYLHEECSRQIIHCDIKPQNILLDEFQNSRISDFGLAKLLVLNQTHTNTAIRGTKGYVAPEWFRNKPVTVKVDVYSFGVLLLEIISCRKSVCMELIEEEGAILIDWAFDCYQSNRLDSLVNDDMEALNDIARLKRFVTVALWCIQEEPSLRPTMRTVTQMLEGVVEVPNNPPCATSFSVTTEY